MQKKCDFLLHLILESQTLNAFKYLVSSALKTLNSHVLSAIKNHKMCCNVYSSVTLNLNPFKIIKKCKSEFYLKIHEALFIKKRNPSLNNRRRRRLEGHPL